eukprot:1785894-Amphidinium_carterae.1
MLACSESKAVPRGALHELWQGAGGPAIGHTAELDEVHYGRNVPMPCDPAQCQRLAQFALGL